MAEIYKIKIGDAEYPKNLNNIYYPPKALYVNGSILPQDDIAIALVGSRRASVYGLEACEKLAFELGLRGITVVSGMAIGIDTAAHRGALKAKARTIAVMGSGHNRIYPPQNEKLYREIAGSGAVVTEFEDDAEPLARHFPQRNRIISGLSLGVIVVEAARNSGALITANFAAEQGRTVFAVPGKISSGTSAGANELIKDGARLVQSVEDVIEELSLSRINPVSKEKKAMIDKKLINQANAYVYNSLTDDERTICRALSDEPVYIDELLLSSGFSSSKAAKILLNLELKKLVKEVPGKQYVRVEN
ncbi:MAG: DNA-processing protein DprA [Candidatus Omnitrophota bacterium]|nr:DNA-processing protein DprA [Candidatus Omnitrophota bacterium]